MNRREIKVDWTTVGLYAFFVLFGWLNIYAASSHSLETTIVDLNYNYGKQLLFIVAAAVLALVLVLLDTKVLEFFSYAAYALTLLLLLLVLVVGREVNGARAWIDLGPFKLQPAEFAKVGTALALAAYMSRWNFSLKKLSQQLVIVGLIVAPMLLILSQPDTGSALVFAAFVLPLYREGLSPALLVLGLLAGLFAVLALVMPLNVVIAIILGLALVSYLWLFRRRQPWLHALGAGLFSGLVLSVDFLMTEVLKPHQQHRIRALFNPNTDPLGTGWNITQSKIAIGSGGWVGKGYLQGTQTKFDFVPQQDTDFIFCTVGEEWGWLGSTVLLLLYLFFLWRLLHLAENTRTRFGRIYGYSVAAIFFLHLAINVGMAIGVAPVIGIPLPFFSYGGSSLIGFTVLLFVLVGFHANRSNILSTERNA